MGAGVARFLLVLCRAAFYFRALVDPVREQRPRDDFFIRFGALAFYKLCDFRGGRDIQAIINLRRDSLLVILVYAVYLVLG